MPAYDGDSSGDCSSCLSAPLACGVTVDDDVDLDGFDDGAFIAVNADGGGTLSKKSASSSFVRVATGLAAATTCGGGVGGGGGDDDDDDDDEVAVLADFALGAAAFCSLVGVDDNVFADASLATEPFAGLAPPTDVNAVRTKPRH